MTFVVVLAVLSLVLGAVASATASAASDLVRVIVRTSAATGPVSEQVEAGGGTVVHQLDALDTLIADVPAATLVNLSTVPGVVSVTRDVRVQALGKPTRDSSNGGSSSSCTDLSKCVPDGQSVGSVKTAALVTGAAELWPLGITGAGVDVALIDTGVTNVPGLDAPGKVIDGPDLSFDGQDPTYAYEDGFGHGTHLAGIIAGRDASIAAGGEVAALSPDQFLGIAPDARIVDVKVGDREGVVDVSQVIAGIDWVIQHRDANGMNIRVINLAFGTNSRQDYAVDPLAYAVEAAWQRGIVVVVAAGNSGHLDGRLTNPAFDPFVIAVGAVDDAGTTQLNDDTIPSWSSRGDGLRNPDVVAPGRSVESLMVPGSAADRDFPGARVGTRLIKGSGTSQATAVVSGIAAQFLQAYPSATPDQVKYALRSTAASLGSADPQAQGQGLVKARGAYGVGPERNPKHIQTFTQATALGSLELARGDAHVVAPDGALLTGEMTVTGSTWSGSTWSGSTWSGSTWSGSTWSGSTWSTGDWLGSTWSGSTWSGSTWSGSTWSGSTWSGSTWSGSTWSGSTWSGSTWSSAGWMGSTWE